MDNPPPPHFNLDAGDHDDQDPPVDPTDSGVDNPENQDPDDDSSNLQQGGPGGPSGPGGPRSPISPDIPNEQRTMLELLSGFKGSIETLSTVLAALNRPSDNSESKRKVKEPEVFDGSDPQKCQVHASGLHPAARRWDVYPKEGDIGYTQVNPHNFHPIFTNEQLTASLRATFLEGPALRALIIMDIEGLHQAIILALPADPSSVVGLELAKDPSNERWSLGSDNLLRLDDPI
ncbi:hypothetical protein F5876DRAFT_80225 [Lentinula aff. lateritia]|uniref:Uncharacterized protein n=1 Tax=Lentinula aff. lateritia TaxID=2804960 RepID=A0ACC1TQC3_9AGAR|nr:hypothetical protein F5876DRAFT_80225 [Lentinula aff. lateritia]